MKLKNLCDKFDKLFRIDLAEPWDNPGLLVGNPGQNVSKVILALDVSLDLIREAKRRNAEVLLVHHPIIFHPLKRLKTTDPTGLLLARTVKSGLSVYAAHTNLDSAPNGINHFLALAIGLEQTNVIQQSASAPNAGLGRYGELPKPERAANVVRKACKAFSTTMARMNGDPDRRVVRVGVCSGAGGDMVQKAIDLELDMFITGDVKHDQFQEAETRGLIVADLGHAETDWFGFRQAVSQLWHENEHISKLNLIVSRNPWPTLKWIKP